MFKKLTALVVICAMSLFGYGDVLYWHITDNARVYENGSWINIQDYVGDREIGARVTVTGGELSQSYYPPIYYQEGEFLDGDLGVDFGDSGSGYWGVGVPTCIQSSIEQLEPSEMYMEYAFMVEIGEYTWNDVMDDWNFNVLAQSDKYAANQLKNYIYERFSLAPPETGIWSPKDFYTTPEPSTSLLCIIGLGVLMLKRKPCHG